MVVQKRKKITGNRSQKVGALLLPIVSTIDFVHSETTFSRCSVLTGFKKEGCVSGKRKHGVVFLAMFLVNYSSSDGFGKTITINLILVGGGFIWGGGSENLPGNSKPTPPTNMRYTGWPLKKPPNVSANYIQEPLKKPPKRTPQSTWGVFLAAAGTG